MYVYIGLVDAHALLEGGGCRVKPIQGFGRGRYPFLSVPQSCFSTDYRIHRPEFKVPLINFGCITPSTLCWSLVQVVYALLVSGDGSLRFAVLRYQQSMFCLSLMLAVYALLFSGALSVAGLCLASLWSCQSMVCQPRVLAIYTLLVSDVYLFTGLQPRGVAVMTHRYRAPKQFYCFD